MQNKRNRTKKKILVWPAKDNHWFSSTGKRLPSFLSRGKTREVLPEYSHKHIYTHTQVEYTDLHIYVYIKYNISFI